MFGHKVDDFGEYGAEIEAALVIMLGVVDLFLFYFEVHLIDKQFQDVLFCAFVEIFLFIGGKGSEVAPEFVSQDHTDVFDVVVQVYYLD